MTSGTRMRAFGIAAVLLAATASLGFAPAAVGSARHKGYVSGRFGARAVDRVVRDLASVGIGVYRAGSADPVSAVRGRVSPLRLTADQARAAALGVWSHAGQSGAALDRFAGPVRLSPNRRLRLGLLVAAWAKRARTPSAALARRMLGHVRWKRYRAVVFPNAVSLLFASDVGVHLGRGRTRRHPVLLAGAAAGPCSAIQNFVTGVIDDVFRAIGHIGTNQAAIDRLFGKGLLGDIVKGVGDILSIGANAAVDAAHQIVLGGVKFTTQAITNAVAGVAAVVDVVGSVTAALVPWAGTIRGSPNPISKGVSAGVPGTFTLDVTAPGGGLQWPEFIADCAGAFGITLPTLTPRDADVRWDIASQDPGQLVIRHGDTGPLDSRGTAKLQFETTTETPGEAAGAPAIGAVVVFARIHRRDLDQLRDRLTQNLLAVLPKILQDTIGPRLRAILAPMIDRATRTITTIQDIQVAGVEAVRYHVPKAARKPPRKRKGTGGSVFGLRIPWPGSQGFTGPLLDIHSCTGLRGPWRGTLNLGPTTLQPPRDVRFTTPTILAGSAAGDRPEPGGAEGEIDHLSLRWNIPVRVSGGAHPTMSFPGATRRLRTVISSPGVPDQVVDFGDVPFREIATRAFPLRASSGACR